MRETTTRSSSAVRWPANRVRSLVASSARPTDRSLIEYRVAMPSWARAPVRTRPATDGSTMANSTSASWVRGRERSWVDLREVVTGMPAGRPLVQEASRTVRGCTGPPPGRSTHVRTLPPDGSWNRASRRTAACRPSQSQSLRRDRDRHGRLTATVRGRLVRRPPGAAARVLLRSAGRRQSRSVVRPTPSWRWRPAPTARRPRPPRIPGIHPRTGAVDRSAGDCRRRPVSKPGSARCRVPSIPVDRDTAGAGASGDGTNVRRRDERRRCARRDTRRPHGSSSGDRPAPPMNDQFPFGVRTVSNLYVLL